MADTSTIEWTDATWNIITGCRVLSPGCRNCYAMKLAGTRLKHHPSRVGLTQPSDAGPVWTGEVRFNEQWLDQPQRWRRPRQIFVCAHGDLFHERVPDTWIDQVFAVMGEAPWHTFQVLTKRARRMRDYMTAPDLQDRLANTTQRLHDEGKLRMLDDPVDTWPLPHVVMMVSAERQQEAEERIPDLLATPAATRGVSLEPLLGPIDLALVRARISAGRSAITKAVCYPRGEPWVDWIICGGESGPRARPMHPDWARSLRDQCTAAGVAFHFKQHGEWLGVPDLRRRVGGTGPGFGAFDHCAFDEEHEAVRVGKKAAGRLLDGVEHNGFPEVPR